MITHADLMNREHPATHSDFYREVIKAANLSAKWPEGFKGLLIREYQSGNVHFNQGANGPHAFNLTTWDALALQINTSALHREIKARGTWVSPATLVCVIKELALMECEKVLGK